MTRPWRVSGRQYYKRGPRRAAGLEDEPVTKKARASDDGDDDIEIFTGTSNFNDGNNKEQNENSGETGSGENPGNISNLAQAVAWYASVDEEARLSDGSLINDHVRGLVDEMVSYSTHYTTVVFTTNSTITRSFPYL